MKKGCFIKSIILLTIVTAAILYIVNHKLNEVIMNPGKGLIISEINRDLDHVKASPEKDSLKILIKNYVEGLKSVKKLSDKSFGDFFDSVKIAIRDSAIDSNEFKSLSRILKRRNLQRKIKGRPKLKLV